MKPNACKSGYGNVIFILICGVGGFLLSLTGLSIGWMVGTLFAAGTLALWRPDPVTRLMKREGIAGYWLKIGQMMLGIQIGQQLNLSVIHAFARSWLMISVMLISAVVLALLSGFALFRYGKTDLVTGLYGTTPGGLTAMVGIAADSGANMAAVSLIQTMRVILVVGTIPIAVSAWSSGVSGTAAASGSAGEPLTLLSAAGLLLAVGSSFAGLLLTRIVHFPAPWMIGSIIGVGSAQMVSEAVFGHDLALWWPDEVIILAQLIIASSIGSHLNRKLFSGIGRIAIVGCIGSVGLLLCMVLAALLVSRLAGIDPITSILAFSPGGIAEMAVTSVVLGADATFVVAVQVLRLLMICIVLPPIINLLNRQHEKPASSRVR